MTIERLETAYNQILAMMKAQGPHGRKLVPIAKHLERELEALRGEEDDYERYMRMASGS